MSVFAHKIQALQIHSSLAEKNLQKHLPLFSRSLYCFMKTSTLKRIVQPLKNFEEKHEILKRGENNAKNQG